MQRNGGMLVRLCGCGSGGSAEVKLLKINEIVAANEKPLRERNPAE